MSGISRRGVKYVRCRPPAPEARGGSPPHLTGSLPPLDYERYRYPSVALTAGEVLRIPPGTLPPEVVDLVNSMMLLDPANRPPVGQVHAALIRVRAPIPVPVPRPAPERPRPRERVAAASSTLRGRGRRAVSRVAEAAPPVPDTHSGRLLGKLLTRSKDAHSP